MIGWCFFVGLKYCPIVSKSQFESTSSFIVEIISSLVSPKPTIIPDLVGILGFIFFTLLIKFKDKS